MSVAAPVLVARDLHKRYPGVHAVKGANFELAAGEVHALIGENGAGKSSLIRLLSGAATPDSGRIEIAGKPVDLSSPAEAREAGIGGVFQELALVPGMTVADNVALGREPLLGSKLRLVDHGEAARLATQTLAELGVAIPPRAKIASLSTAERQLVEIARAIAMKPSVLIMDEPTSSLAGNDVDRLLDIVRRLRADGTAIVFVSHRLEEVLGIADRITVMRGGEVVATLGTGRSISQEELIELMTGRSAGEMFPARKSEPGEVVLRVKGLGRKSAFSGIDLDLRRGEILGLAGLVGAGRTEVVRAICGIDRPSKGEIELDGEKLDHGGPRTAISRGLVYVPEDRKDLGLALGLSGYENASMPSLRRLAPNGIVVRSKIRAEVDNYAKRIGVRGRLERPVRTLSGGNQQKVVLAKWLMTGAKVLVLDEPTRGIDVGAKHDVYEFIRDRCAEGIAVLVVSSELPELTHLCDRIMVMSGGRVHDHLSRDEFDEKRILQAAFAGQTVRHFNEEGVDD